VNVDALRQTFLSDLERITDSRSLEEVRLKYFSRKSGLIKQAFASMKDLAPEDRKGFGASINALQAEMEEAFSVKESELAGHLETQKLEAERIDVTLPGLAPARGHLHPITLMRREMEEIFSGMGYTVESGPEIENDWFNFTALNMPPDHPARDTQDTFYLEDGFLLRTHTSNIQIHTMMNHQPPLLILAPGRVFRRDDSPRHSPQFHQVEGFAIDRKMDFRHFKGTLEHFLNRLFGEGTKVRFRPSFFPFTEPSAEVDISCIFCSGEGCTVCSRTGWVEIMGAGMIHPAVLNNVGFDPEEWMGFAFGMGLDRVAMLKYGIPNIRLLFESDVRLLEQF